MSEKEVTQIRKLLLDFYSSELTTHSRLIIGFSVILFTILQIVQKLSETDSLAIEQIWISIFSMWLTAGTLWYLLMRHISYGALSSAVIHTPLNQDATLRDANIAIRDEALNHKLLFIFPSCLFIPSGEKKTWLQKKIGLWQVQFLGFVICFGGLGSVSTYLLSRLIELL